MTETTEKRSPRLVIIESPYAGDVELNVAYARAAVKDCLLRGEAPYASHLLYTQPGVLDDADKAQRQLGMEAGFAWAKAADATVVYSDLGVTSGMKGGITRAEKVGRPVEVRYLDSVTDGPRGLGWRNMRKPAPAPEQKTESAPEGGDPYLAGIMARPSKAAPRPPQ